MRLRNINLLLVLALICSSCNQNHVVDNSTDQFTSGAYNFVFDESLSPILDQEIYVFKSLYAEAKPNVIYQPENKILDLVLNNKARFAVMSRDLHKDEVNLLTNRGLPPKVGKVAYDAVTLIVNKSISDTVMSLDQIKYLFSPDTKNTKSLVFDNPNSSVLNYLKTYFNLKSGTQKNVYAVKNSKDVIKYVAEHGGAIGFISYSWLIEPDSDYADAVKNIKIVGIKSNSADVATSNYFKPSQSTFALKQYPLTRSIYVVDCTGKIGLGTGFASFLQSERGQKIVLRSGLLPDSMPTREISIKKEM
ncbi:MAG: phosphate ABC transporter substrate-binding protein [Sphingobacteriaceae bacterium]|nr:MAG: phosphate ABC transporter substrate-binding protein [Sphingobacteriaceae bacterium]